MNRGFRPSRKLLALAGICILALALHSVGADAILQALARCRPVPVLAAIAAIVVGTLLGAWNVFRIAELESIMSFSRFLPVFWRSWAAGITLPGQVADVLTTLWQLKGRSGNLDFIGGRLLADKAITLAATLAMASTLPFVIGGDRVFGSVLLLAAFAIASISCLAFFAWLARRPALLERVAWAARLRPILAATRVPFAVGLGNASLTVMKIAISGFAYWAVLNSLAGNAPGIAATTVISQSAGLIAYVPISFNGIGTVEVSAAALFHLVGVESAVVLSAYLILRAATLAVAWLPAAWWTWRATVAMK